MEQTLCYTETMTMSKYYSNPCSWGQNHDNLIKESRNEQKGSRFSLQKQNTGRDFIHRAYVPTSEDRNNDEYEIEDDESEFKMGRLIRQASFNSSQMSSPQQTTKVMKESSSLPRYLSEKPETAQEKISSMRKLESMNERSSRSKKSMKLGKNYSGAPLIPGGWVDKGSSEDMKAQIKFWARAVAFNVHQEC
ncbi:hypothetical protein CTI12_AA076890 [Artemisia annua]|uniref:Uncharacterized protein n=1 Tax=Artemisia annua TaxID=35608 RepID=A0A2U1Q473_ARTAN|nr:hypothetical protein CTI12_AA076890 [Artemisia annua]